MTGSSLHANTPSKRLYKSHTPRVWELCKQDSASSPGALSGLNADIRSSLMDAMYTTKSSLVCALRNAGARDPDAASFQGRDQIKMGT